MSEEHLREIGPHFDVNEESGSLQAGQTRHIGRTPKSDWSSAE